MSAFRAATRPVRMRLALAVALGVGAAGCAIGLIVTSGWLISRSAQRPAESALALAIVGVQLFALGRGLLRYCERLAGHDAALRVLARLRVQVFARLERLAPAGLPAFRRGDLLARLVGDVDAIQDLLLRVGPPFSIAVLVGGAAALVAYAMLPAAGVILLALLVLATTLVPWAAGRLARRTAGRRAELRGELGAEVVDLLSGSQELLLSGALPGAVARVDALDARLTALARSEARTAGIGQGLVRGLSGVAMWGSLSVGVAAVAGARLDGVLLAGLALIPLALFELLSPLPAAAQTRQSVRRSESRLSGVLEAPLPVRAPAHPLSLPGGGRLSLSARGVRARYPGREEWALDGVELDLPPAGRVAVVGASGAGKSTLGWVLLGFLAYEGSVTIDGVELSELEEAAVRGAVGMVEQDPHVFAGTLAANLRLARPEASDTELVEVLSSVRLDAWLGALPDGLETELGERISGGQRQRLGLARALLADFPILILDEPTEHVEREGARAILDDLLSATAGRSTLLITHELDGLDRFDEIVVLDRGRVAERGTHEQLLARGGPYATLWEERGSREPA